MVEVILQAEGTEIPVSEDEVSRFVAAAMESAGSDADSVGILLADDRQLGEMNAAYRGKVWPSDFDTILQQAIAVSCSCSTFRFRMNIK